MKQDSETIRMTLNEEGTYVVDRNPIIFLREDPNKSGPLSYINLYDKTLNKIRRNGKERRYYSR